MKRSLAIVLSSLGLLIGLVAFIWLGYFVFVDCADILKAGYSDEIGFGMSLIAFHMIAFFLPGLILEFVDFCKSSGSPDDK